MKKLLLVPLGMMLLFASCKKSESELTTKQQLHEVKFNVAVFNQSIGSFPGQAANANPSGGKLMSADATQTAGKLSNYIDRLDYYLYNAQGVKIANRTISADTSAMGFALPSASLPAGTYTAVFVGSAHKSEYGESLGISGEGLNNFYIYNTLYGQITDVFTEKTQFTVANANDSVDVTLKRPGGKLKIVIQDEWPANVDRIGLSINGYIFYYFNGHISQNDRSDITIPKNYLWTKDPYGNPVQTQTYVDCSWENFIFTDPSDVTMLNGVVTAYGKNNDVIATKNINSIRVERNKITTVSGKLFDNLNLSTKSSFNIKIDADLSGEINQSF